MTDIIAAFPFTLTNGNPNDASQVMANLNRIRDDVNENVVQTLTNQAAVASQTSAFSFTLPANASISKTVVKNTGGTDHKGAMFTLTGFTGTSADLTPRHEAFAAVEYNLDATYANGTLGVGATLTNAGAKAAFDVTINGSPVVCSLNDYILVFSQTTKAQNGLYKITTIGSGAANWVLTRSTDFDQAAEVVIGAYVCVENAIVIDGTPGPEIYVQKNSGPFVMGTTAIEFLKSSSFASGNKFSVPANNLLIEDANMCLDPADEAQGYHEGFYSSTSAATVFYVAVADNDGTTTPSWTGQIVSLNVMYDQLT